MQFLFVLLGILLLLVLIHFKFSAVLALLISAIATGLMLGMPAAKLVVSINNGIGWVMEVKLPWGTSVPACGEHGTSRPCATPGRSTESRAGFCDGRHRAVLP